MARTFLMNNCHFLANWFAAIRICFSIWNSSTFKSRQMEQRRRRHPIAIRHYSRNVMPYRFSGVIVFVRFSSLIQSVICETYVCEKNVHKYVATIQYTRRQRKHIWADERSTLSSFSLARQSIQSVLLHFALLFSLRATARLFAW